ncbi:MAG: hypothetical protein RBU37_02910, partial [Myxococcota bacterium]|nr:hypothetical protein [Myxococcota bacterium]
MPRLTIIDPSVRISDQEGIDVIQRVWNDEVHLFRPPLFAEWPTKSELRAADVIALLGSVASVNQSHDWLQRLQELLFDALQRPSLACIGICFGHQLINKLFGGRVDFHSPDHQQNSGIESARFSPNRLGTSTRYSVIVAHSELVVET